MSAASRIPLTATGGIVHPGFTIPPVAVSGCCGEVGA
jgi:hypothetical protein